MSTDAGRFFRRYNRTIALAYGALLLAVGGFFAWQLHDTLHQELALIRGQVDRHHQLLEFMLRGAADQVETLRMATGRSVASEAPSPSTCPLPVASLAQAGLREHGGGFHRDALADRDAGGNLVGPGGLARRSNRFYCDLAAALALDSHLAAMAFHLPQAARVRFLSGERFQLVAPWRPARELPFGTRLYEDPVWRLGHPSANPERLKYWPPVHFGDAEAGLLATVAAPVYDRERFMGVVAIDLSLDQLQRINGSWGQAPGQVAVIDASGKVLAHPGLYADPLAVQVPAGLRQLFEPDVIDSLATLLSLPEGEVVQRGGWTLVRRSFRAAPWQLVWAAPRAQLWRRLLAERAGTMGAVLAALAAIMLVTYAVTRREFVGPAARLVEHLVAQARFAPRPVPRVPRAWRPWFDAITQAFQRSLELSSLRAELDIAARLQQSILPRRWPADARFGLCGATTAAREVGGDFHDHFLLADGRCALVVADVSDKGVAAGLFAMVCRTLLRAVALQRQADPSEVARHVNEGLCADNDSSMFVTAFVGQYHPESARLDYVSAGHPPSLLVRSNGACEWLSPTGGAALGVVEEARYAQATVVLLPGDTVFAYTDGVTEAENAQGELFGRARLQALFEQRPCASAREAVDRVLQAVADFSQGAQPSDDITCMALQCHRNGAPA